MAVSTDILVRFLADTKGVQKGVKEVEGTGSKLKSAAKGMAVAIGGAFAAAKIGEFAKDSVKAASDLSESMSKVGVVFGASAKDVEAWSKSSATSMGLSQQAALEAAGTYGNLAVSLGLPQKQAAEMSTTLTGLAGDLASFNNVPVGDALDALRSGLTGETEPLKKFGVNLNEAALRAQAMSMGLVKGKGPLTASAKAQAAYALIMKQTTTAQGDFARTSGGLANQQRIAAAQVENMKAKLGTALLPVMQQVVKLLNQYIIPALTTMGRLFSDNATWLIPLVAALGALFVAVKVAHAATAAWEAAQMAAKAVTVIWTGVQTAFNAVMYANPILLVVVAIAALIAAVILAYQRVGWFRAAVDAAMKGIVIAFNWLRNAAVAVFNWLKTNWPLLLAIITGPFGVAVLMVKRNWESIKGAAAAVFNWFASTWHALTAIITAPFTAAWSIISGIWEAIKGGATAVFDWVKSKFDALVGAITNVISGVSGAVSSVVNAVKGPINAVIRAWNNIRFTVPSFKLPEFSVGPVHIGGETIGGWTIDFPNIPELAGGGIVRAPTLALVGERGPEAVIPLGRTGNSYSINVNVAAADPVTTGRVIVSLIQRYERANSAAWRGA